MGSKLMAKPYCISRQRFCSPRSPGTLRQRMMFTDSSICMCLAIIVLDSPSSCASSLMFISLSFSSSIIISRVCDASAEKKGYALRSTIIDILRDSSFNSFTMDYNTFYT